MILLNWNFSFLTALASLNSNNCDVFEIDQSGILEQRGFHIASPSSGVSRLLDKALESRGGAGNEVVMKIFHHNCGGLFLL